MIIQLPLVPTDDRQAKSVVDILRRELPSYHQPGVQIYRGPLDMYAQVPDKELVSYVRRNIPSGFVITLHAPISPREPRKDVNLAYSEALDIHLKNIRLAKRISARSLTIHPNTVFYTEAYGRKHPEIPHEFIWWPELDDYEIMWQKIRKPFYDHIRRLASQTDLIIGVETMPIPIKGDITTDPDEILYEPNMTAREDATEFCESTKQNENLKITFDTAHTKSAQEVLNRIRKNGLTTKKDLKRTPFRGIYLEQTRQQPDIYHFLEEFLRREKIADVQLSDVGRLWKPYCHTLSEGAVLGDGLIGDEVFDIAQNSMKYPDIPISIDVSEEDYINRPNQLKSLRRLLERLK